jgi:hypothetical protein
MQSMFRNWTDVLEKRRFDNFDRVTHQKHQVTHLTHVSCLPMNKQHLKAPTVFLFFILAASAMAQVKEITIQALDGKTGKPLANQRLLVFAGDTAEAATFHHQDFVLTTDTGGRAKLPITSPGTKWIQVWADGLTLCQTKPNSLSFKVETIATLGLSAPNTCSPLAQAPKSGVFIVFARESTLSEKMAR